MQWVHDQADKFNWDRSRIVASGSSAGGHLAAAISSLPTFQEKQFSKTILRPKALFLLQPVLDNGPNDGYGYERVGRTTEKYSPAHHVTSDFPPTFLCGAHQDNAAKLSALRRFHKNMKEQGNTCTLIEFDGKHGFIMSLKFENRS